MLKIIFNHVKKVINKFLPNQLGLIRACLVFKRTYGLNPLKRLVIFDVGANNGDNFIELTRLPWIEVHAFEPTPELIRIILERSSGRSNYILNEVAISDFEGQVVFNVAGQGDWGCSSLLEFSENVSETWSGREDLKVTNKISVNSIKLSTYVKRKNIKRIDLLHIDVQGHDLIALKSLEKFIEIVDMGVVEVPFDDKVKLYKNQHSKLEMLEFLRKSNFHILKVESQQNEENLFFYRCH
jgi:FkbM family methyltransferase